MAITAVITCTPDSTTPNRRISASCVLSNSGGSDVDVVGIRPLITPSGSTKESVAGNCGLPPVGPGNDITIPAGSTLTMSWPVVIFKPTVNGVADTYDVGAVIDCSDGSVVTATVDTVTITGADEESED